MYSLNAVEVVQLKPIKPSVPLQMIDEERRNINSVKFIFPTVQSNASQNHPTVLVITLISSVVLNKLKLHLP